MLIRPLTFGLSSAPPTGAPSTGPATRKMLRRNEGCMNYVGEGVELGQVEGEADERVDSALSPFAISSTD